MENSKGIVKFVANVATMKTRAKFKLLKIIAGAIAFVLLVILMDRTAILPNICIETLSEEDNRTLIAYINQKCAEQQNQDYLKMDTQYFLKATHVKNYMTLLIEENGIKAGENLLYYEGIVDSLMAETLKGEFKYEGSTVTKKVTTPEKTETKADGTTSTIPSKTETTTENVKVLTYVKSIYRTGYFSYTTETTSTTMEDGTVVEITKPKLESSNLSQQYERLKEIFKKELGYDSEEDMQELIRYVIFSDNGDGSVSSNLGGQLNGIPADQVQYINEVSSLTGIPNWYIAAFAKVESDFNPSCVSYDGGYGVLQFTGYDNFEYNYNLGMGAFINSHGYSFSSASEAWSALTGLQDCRLQYLCGGYEMLYFLNAYLMAVGKVPKDYTGSGYFNVQNAAVVPWDRDLNDAELKEEVIRIALCYNGGVQYGTRVSIEGAQNNHGMKVYNACVEIRNNMTPNLDTGGGGGPVVEKAIQAGTSIIGIGTYGGCHSERGVEGDGRDQQSIAQLAFDCSSFVRWCYAQAGADLGINSYTVSQVQSGKNHEAGFSYVEVSGQEQYQRGDLIFFNNCSHVGIWLGNGQFLHCGTSSNVSIQDYNYYVTYVQKADGYVVRYTG